MAEGTIGPILEPPPARFNIARYCLASGGPRDPAKTALLLVNDADALEAAERWTFAGLDEAVRRAASGLLAAGLRPGERLVIVMPNSADFLLLFFGALAAGIVPVPASSLLTRAEVAYLIADAEPAAIAVGGGRSIPGDADLRVFDEKDIAAIRAAPPLSGYADTAAEDPAFLIYTSGTSRRPKGVLHAHRVLWARRPSYDSWSGLGPSDVMFHAGAYNWSFTLTAGLADPWANGATAVLYAGPRDPSVWAKVITGAGATLFAAVPGVYRQMLKYGDIERTGTGHLRHGLVAGEAFTPALLAKWRAATGLEIYEAFGMTECSTFVSNRPGLAIRPGSPGKPQPGRRVVALPVESGTEPVPQGEIGLLSIHRSDPGVMLGYWRRPEEEAIAFRGEWFVSGDAVSFDADGYVWFHGRADDVMNAGGYRVSPLEVEAAIADHGAVVEVAAAEHRVRDGLSVVAAWIVPKPDVTPDAALAREIVGRSAASLAAYKQPREVFFVPALPRTPNGKVARRLLDTLGATPALGAPGAARARGGHAG